MLPASARSHAAHRTWLPPQLRHHRLGLAGAGQASPSELLQTARASHQLPPNGGSAVESTRCRGTRRAVGRGQRRVRHLPRLLNPKPHASMVKHKAAQSGTQVCVAHKAQGAPGVLTLARGQAQQHGQDLRQHLRTNACVRQTAPMQSAMPNAAVPQSKQHQSRQLHTPRPTTTPWRARGRRRGRTDAVRDMSPNVGSYRQSITFCSM